MSDLSIKGIILPSGLGLEEHKDLSVLGGVSGDTLKKYILYWDKIDIPQSTRIGYNHSPDITFLKEHGVLEMTIIDEGKTFSRNVESPLDKNIRCLEQKNLSSQGVWSIAGDYSDSYKSPESTTSQLMVNILCGLPIPGSDISFEDILNFKQKRNPELLQFRDCMNRLYDGLSKEYDQVTRINKIEHEISKSISDLNKVYEESFVSRLKASVDISINPAGLGASLLGDSPALSALIATLTSISLNLRNFRATYKVPDNLTDFAYLVSVQKELK